MFCDRCGTSLPERTNFCPSCGKSVGITPLMPVHSRIAGHVRLLGIFWLALSALHLFPGIMLISFGAGWGAVPFGIPGFVQGIMSVVGWAMVAGSVLGLVAGWGLLQREPWARTLAIVMGVVHLLNVPFGTALGVYTLWVLLPAASEQEYRNVARAA